MRRRDLIGLGLGLASSKLFCAPPAAWDLSCDVAVAGGGGAGLSAALAAAQNGASVMLFEKMPHIGGDTLISGGYFNAVDPARQKVQGICDSEALLQPRYSRRAPAATPASWPKPSRTRAR